MVGSYNTQSVMVPQECEAEALELGRELSRGAVSRRR
jgi:hypothetical protein